jgi:microcin C transport system permease protein
MVASIVGRRASIRSSSPSLSANLGSTNRRWNAFALMIWNYARFDFGESYFRDVEVIDLIIEKLPVSISLGLWMTLLSYGISIPLGIAKAVKDGTRFDMWTSAVVIVGYAIPGFLFAILLIVLFAGGSFWDLFPLTGLTSENWDQLSWWQKILDYFWHLTLPLIAMAVGAFATTTLLTKNSFLDEIRKQYVTTARAKGLGRAHGALRPRFPQRDADHHRRFPRRLHLRVLHRLAADRDDLLARRAGSARL